MNIYLYVCFLYVYIYFYGQFQLNVILDYFYTYTNMLNIIFILKINKLCINNQWWYSTKIVYK